MVSEKSSKLRKFSMVMNNVFVVENRLFKNNTWKSIAPFPEKIQTFQNYHLQNRVFYTETKVLFAIFLP